jgi:hypothetical protein
VAVSGWRGGNPACDASASGWSARPSADPPAGAPGPMIGEDPGADLRGQRMRSTPRCVPTLGSSIWP